MLHNFRRNIFNEKQLDGLTHKLLLFNSIIGHIYDNHIKFEVSLHVWEIWPTVWQCVNLSYLMFYSSNSLMVSVVTLL